MLLFPLYSKIRYIIHSFYFQWDVKTHQKVKISSEHQKSISDLQLSSDRKYKKSCDYLLKISDDFPNPMGTIHKYYRCFLGTMFISASKDTTAKLWDMDQLEDKKTYKTERPVNSAAISPNKDHVVLGGGQVKNSHLILHFRDDK